ncbi:MAG TPA: sulfurtransferase TusA family protein, partial [Acidimicrobiales bacterium]|nr:sulfurtransferase TusA family protein [Acidimicrobiales bacterium]
MSPPPTIDLEGLGFEEGAHLLLKRGLATVPAGGRLEVRGRAPALAVHLRAWCRSHGHRVEWPDSGGVNPNGAIAVVVRGEAGDQRWSGAERAGAPDPSTPGAVVDHPSPRWGLAARGALVEAGGPDVDFELDDRAVVWADVAPKLYAQAAAGQWDPATAVDWDAPRDHPARRRGGSG